MSRPEARELIAEVRERGRLTVATFMDLALYHPQFGYYARAARRSGRAGDFFTSVDVGPLFGELLAVQVADMAAHLAPSAPFDLVEAGAGDGRLAADMLRGLARHAPALLSRTRVHLAEISAEARAAQAVTLGPFVTHLASATRDLPPSFEGVLVANELLDAQPVHRLVRREGVLREVYVTADPHAPDRLTTVEGELSSPAAAACAADFDHLARTLADGQYADISPAALAWVRQAGARLTRGFILLLDYGYPEDLLYSPARAGGTLSSYRGHVSREASDDTGDASAGWLRDPGTADLTAHVDLTAVQRTAVSCGLEVLGCRDQTYFLLGLLAHKPDAGALAADTVPSPAGSTTAMKQRLALKTLMLPGGLGSTIKVVALGKHVGRPSLAGFPPGGRLTP